MESKINVNNLAMVSTLDCPWRFLGGSACRISTGPDYNIGALGARKLGRIGAAVRHLDVEPASIVVAADLRELRDLERRELVRVAHRATRISPPTKPPTIERWIWSECDGSAETSKMSNVAVPCGFLGLSWNALEGKNADTLSAI